MTDMSNVRRLRANKRFRLFRPTQMYVSRDIVPVDLLDLSVSGALVNSAQPPAVGTRVRLTILGKPRLALVVRRDGRQFGVEFATPLVEGDVFELAQARHAATAVA